MIRKSIIDLIDKPISGEWGEDPVEEPIIKVIRNTNFTSTGKLDLSNVVERSIPQQKIHRKSLKNGDIIIEKSGGSPNQPVGRVVYYDQNDGDYLFSNFTSALRPRKEVFPRYLFYMMFAHYRYNTTLAFQNKTTGIINLQLSRYLEKTKILLPPLENQKKIAAILDKADELRRNDQKILEKYDQLAQSVFLEMFGDPVINPKGWDKTRFDQVGSIERGVSKNRPRNAPELLSGKHPLIQTGDVANCELYIQEYDSTYSDIGLAQSKKWPKGTLCITIAANIAKTGILSFEACFPDSVVGFLPNKKTNIIYIHFWLSFLQKILESTAPESAQKNINLRILRELELPLPPIIEQNRFEEIIKYIETQKLLTQQSLQKSEELFQSLLQKAFKGEITGKK